MLAVKSTIDKVCIDLATASGIKFLDLDDATAVEGVMQSTDSAVIWELQTFDESPQDPMWSISFGVGGRTSNDASNYEILALTGAIASKFTIGTQIPIFNYSGTTVGLQEANMTVISNNTAPQLFDRTSGLRLAGITAKLLRFTS